MAETIQEFLQGAQVGYETATVVPLTATDRLASFTLSIHEDYTVTLPLDLGFGENAFMEVWLPEQQQMQVAVEVGWDYTTSFEVTDTQFSWTLQSGDRPLTIQVDATLSDYVGYGRAGVLWARLCQACDPAGGDGTPATFQINRTYAVSLLDSKQISITTTGSTDPLQLDIQASFLPTDLIPGVSDGLHPDALDVLRTKINCGVEAHAAISYGLVDPLSEDPRSAISVLFSDVQLDLLTVYSEFLRPLVAPMAEAIKPFAGFVDSLLAPLPVVSQVAGKDISLLDLPSWLNSLTFVGSEILGDNAGEIVSAFSSAKSTALWVQQVIGIWNSLASMEVPVLPSWSVDDFSVRFSAGKWTPNLSGQQGEDSFGDFVQQFTSDVAAVLNSLRGRTQSGSQASVTMQLPFISKTGSGILALLTGDSQTQLFSVNGIIDTGPISLGAATFPILPPWLEVALRPTINLGLELGAGYDAQGVAEVTSLVERDVAASGVSSWAEFTEWIGDEYDGTERVLRYVSPLLEGFYLDDHVQRHGTGSQLPYESSSDAPEGWLNFDLNVEAFAGLDLKVVKAGVTLSVTPGADFEVDLNDLPNKVNGVWPADVPSSMWTYDGRIRPSELSQIWYVDPLALVNGSVAFTVGLSVGIQLEVFGFTILDKSIKIAEETLWKKTLGADDAEIMRNVPRNLPVFAHQEGSALVLHMKPDHPDERRENTNAMRDGPDNIVNERFEVKSLGWIDQRDHSKGERVAVFFSENTADGDPPYVHQAVFPALDVENPVGIRDIFATGDDANPDDGDDMIVIDSSVHAGASLSGGAGNDTLIYSSRNVYDENWVLLDPAGAARFAEAPVMTRSKAATAMMSWGAAPAAIDYTVVAAPTNSSAGRAMARPAWRIAAKTCSTGAPAMMCSKAVRAMMSISGARVTISSSRTMRSRILMVAKTGFSWRAGGNKLRTVTSWPKMT